MTIPIKTIPPLTGKPAERFHRIRNEVIPYSIDFSKEVESCRKIIEKSKMKYLLITILLFSCQATRMYDSEGFYIEQQNVYHYSVYGDTTLINYRDTEILRNDTLIQFYTKQNQ